MIIPMLCVTIFVILVVWFLLPRVARLMIHTPTAISIFVCLSMVQLMAVFISMRCTLCGHFLQVALTLILVVGYVSYSGVKSPTECQQSLFESHFASRQSLSDCPVAFWKVFFILKFRLNPYRRGRLNHNHVPSIKLRESRRKKNTKNPSLNSRQIGTQ